MRHAPALDTGTQADRQRRPQIGAVEHQGCDAMPFHAHCQAAPHGLDFRQFGHGSGGAGGAGGAMLQHMAGTETSGEADFGYRRVNAEEKPHLVRQVFDSVVDRYDLMNDLMSGGIHRLWKAELIDRLGPRPGQLLLDVAGGTGDIARRFLDRAGPAARAVVCDITHSMLRRGRDRAIDRGRGAGIDWVCGAPQRLRAGRNVVRLIEIAFILARYDALFPLERIVGLRFAVRALGVVRRRDAALARLRPGQRLAAALQAMGPSFIKLGQALSTRADLIGEAVATALSGLPEPPPPLPAPPARAPPPTRP